MSSDERAIVGSADDGSTITTQSNDDAKRERERYRDEAASVSLVRVADCHRSIAPPERFRLFHAPIMEQCPVSSMRCLAFARIRCTGDVAA